MWLIRNTTNNIKHAIWQLKHMKARYWHNIISGLCRAIGRDISVFAKLLIASIYPAGRGDDKK